MLIEIFIVLLKSYKQCNFRIREQNLFNTKYAKRKHVSLIHSGDYGCVDILVKGIMCDVVLLCKIFFLTALPEFTEYSKLY